MSHEEGVGAAIQSDVVGVIPEPTIVGTADGAAHGLHLLGSAGLPVAEPLNDDAVDEKNSAAFAVSTMSTSAVIAWAECFFLDVGEDEDVVRSDRAPVSKQVSRARLDDSLVGDVREHKASTRTKEASAGMGHGDRQPVGTGQDLNAERERRCSPNLAADDAERSSDLGTDRGPFHVRAIVGVLEDQAVKPSMGVVCASDAASFAMALTASRFSGVPGSARA